ncbi:uncharacterized protein LOC102073008 isoform X2 [Zonotrichia albicollis]|uniref:uncharacterized protein LOC102073008 isoform X2 n=1 Tax=Zonotrichia albicollis TaxID=44394 RepID=UPI003D80E5A1
MREQHKKEVLRAALNPFGGQSQKGARGLDASFTSCIYSDHSPSLFSRAELSPASLPVDSQSATWSLCEPERGVLRIPRKEESQISAQHREECWNFWTVHLFRHVEKDKTEIISGWQFSSTLRERERLCWNETLLCVQPA